MRHAFILLGVLLLTGCAGFSPDGGLVAVNDLTQSALPQNAVALRTLEDADRARAEVKAWLARPLTADSAVRIALLNNRALQAAYNALGLSEAAMVQASLPPNPTFSVERIAGRGGAFELESRVIGSVLTLATLPARAEIAADRFRQAQLQAAEETLRVASEARRAFYRAVAARALVTFLTQTRETGETAAQLAKRLGETGAMNKLDQARNQAFSAELVAQLAAARLRAAAERERLVRALGLWGDDLDFRLPGALPPLPRVRSLASTEVEAVRRRVDLQMARIEVDVLAKSYGLSGATRFINLLDVAGISKKQREEGATVRERGFEVEFQIPLFDFGAVKMKQAEESYLQAVNRLTAKAVNVRSEAREAYYAYRASYDIARLYRRDVLALRKIISDETLLRYNAMQIDVFALLIEARQRITATNAAIEAERDFWLAEVNLGTAVIGGNTTTSPESTASTGPAESPGGH
jgi:outer membrane protein TolC